MRILYIYILCIYIYTVYCVYYMLDHIISYYIILYHITSCYIIFHIMVYIIVSRPSVLVDPDTSPMSH